MKKQTITRGRNDPQGVVFVEDLAYNFYVRWKETFPDIPVEELCVLLERYAREDEANPTF